MQRAFLILFFVAFIGCSSNAPPGLTEAEVEAIVTEKLNSQAKPKTPSNELTQQRAAQVRTDEAIAELRSELKDLSAELKATRESLRDEMTLPQTDARATVRSVHQLEQKFRAKIREAKRVGDADRERELLEELLEMLDAKEQAIFAYLGSFNDEDTARIKEIRDKIERGDRLTSDEVAEFNEKYRIPGVLEVPSADAPD